MPAEAVLEHVQAPQLTVSQGHSLSRSERVVFYSVFGLLLFGPLAFGAVEPWSTFILETGAAGLSLFWMVTQIRSGEVRVVSCALFLPMLAFAGLIAVQVAFGLTAYRQMTLCSALLYCAYGMVSFLVIQCLRRTWQVETLTKTLSWYGFAMAVFAVVQSVSSSGKLYWTRIPLHGGWIYGPYVNHDHYAGLMEMLAPVPLVFVFTRYARGPQKTLAAVGAAVMASSIFLSGSRGGMAAFAVQLVTLAVLARKSQKSRKAALAAGIFLAVVVGLLAWLGGGELINRMASIRTEAQSELSGGTRMAIDRDAITMFTHRPLLGWGLGTFPTVYPQFRSFYTNFFVNAAHNDYLQLLTDTGVFGFATMCWFVVVLYRRALRKMGDWPSDTNGAVALAAMLGVTGVLVHSLVDFNLQIPANAAFFYVLCVVAAMEPRFGTTRRRSAHPRDSILEMPSAD